MSNLECMGIYGSWLDRAVELSYKLAESAGLDGDDIFDTAHDSLDQEKISFKEISQILVSEMLYSAKVKTDERLEDLGFEEGKIIIDTYAEGLNSSISINQRNQSLVDAVKDVLLEDFGFIPNIQRVILAVEAETPGNINELLESFADKLSDELSKSYNIEFEFEDDKFTLNHEPSKQFNVSEMRDFVKSAIDKEKDKNKNSNIEFNN